MLHRIAFPVVSAWYQCHLKTDIQQKVQESLPYLQHKGACSLYYFARSEVERMSLASCGGAHAREIGHQDYREHTPMNSIRS